MNGFKIKLPVGLFRSHTTLNYGHQLDFQDLFRGWNQNLDLIRRSETSADSISKTGEGIHFSKTHTRTEDSHNRTVIPFSVKLTRILCFRLVERLQPFISGLPFVQHPFSTASYFLFLFNCDRKGTVFYYS